MIRGTFKGLLILGLLAWGWQRGYAQVGAQSNQATVKPLYTITHDLEQSSTAYYGSGVGTSLMVASYKGVGAPPSPLIRAWTGGLTSVGATMPQNAPNVAISGGRPVLRVTENPWDPDIENTPPLGDTPYWLFGLLLLGYCFYRKRRVTAE